MTPIPHREQNNPTADRASWRRQIEETERKLRILRQLADGEINCAQAMAQMED